MARADAIPEDAGVLRISEIFFSLQGETVRSGLPTVFIRLTGCPLRCRWCDTTHAFSGGETLPIGDIVARVRGYPSHRVTVTGGEPLAQKACLNLLRRLCDAGCDVSLETSGALPIDAVDPRVARVLDLKPPGSGEAHRNHWPNLDLLGTGDEVKFVIADRTDYEWARDALRRHALAERCGVLFSPVSGEQDATLLAQWILDDGLPVRLQLQLHKILWGNVPGR